MKFKLDQAHQLGSINLGWEGGPAVGPWASLINAWSSGLKPVMKAPPAALANSSSVNSASSDSDFID